MTHRSNRLWGKVLICAGVLVLLVSAGLLAYNIWDNNRAAESTARVTRLLFEQIEVNKKNRDPGTDSPVVGESEDDLSSEQPQDDNNNDTEDTSVSASLDGERYIGILSIPALSLELPINYSWDYNKLKKTPCRYAGGINDSLVIAGHNYRNHFNPLTRLRKGDSVKLTDMAGVEHFYIVEKIETMSATDIGGMLDSSYDLTLFTCNYSGMARVAVRCVRHNP